jgi:hypothetical protein
MSDGDRCTFVPRQARQIVAGRMQQWIQDARPTASAITQAICADKAEMGQPIYANRPVVQSSLTPGALVELFNTETPLTNNDHTGFRDPARGSLPFTVVRRSANPNDPHVWCLQDPDRTDWRRNSCRWITLRPDMQGRTWRIVSGTGPTDLASKLNIPDAPTNRRKASTPAPDGKRRRRSHRGETGMRCTPPRGESARYVRTHLAELRQGKQRYGDYENGWACDGGECHAGGTNDTSELWHAANGTDLCPACALLYRDTCATDASPATVDAPIPCPQIRRAHTAPPTTAPPPSSTTRTLSHPQAQQPKRPRTEPHRVTVIPRPQHRPPRPPTDPAIPTQTTTSPPATPARTRPRVESDHAQQSAPKRPRNQDRRLVRARRLQHTRPHSGPQREDPPTPVQDPTPDDRPAEEPERMDPAQDPG